ncbi:DinB family protein [Flavobacterium inviolabile]|uniref:DinB family protein n=1 Tax=Flavobacterium inviolabile TaxID=2748320 RepID=UPI0015AF7FB0|nr:DinB family protein [Flavobacterium inviolabile]
MKTDALLDELTAVTLNNIAIANHFKTLDTEALNWRQFTKSWTILECIEHLNRYGDFYTKALYNAIRNTKFKKPEPVYKSGLLGGYFARTIKETGTKKMKTFRAYDPLGISLNEIILDIFIAQQEELLQCLDSARQVNVMKSKTGISISKWIRLQLGDTFQFVIYHNERHLKQAESILKQYNHQYLPVFKIQEFNHQEDL